MNLIDADELLKWIQKECPREIVRRLPPIGACGANYTGLPRQFDVLKEDYLIDKIEEMIHVLY